MIINTPDSSIQSSGKMRTAGFQMRASAKGFRIISTTLYKDPILAIVRELICNGWDAQIANGNINTPIEVHIPNPLEPWFAVKDNGIGMSDDEIFGVYTTVFDSTKDQSNDAIGAMGLGSKTPFSYNNGQSFTVVSIKDGKKAVYSAYLDSGEPAITCMIEPHDTDEPSGVEVKVPANSVDYSRFLDAANKIVPFFSMPSVNTNQQMQERDFEFMDGYITEPSNYTSNVFAIMGNVCYPIDKTKINAIWKLSSYFKSSNLYINFSIGELDVSASREELHYDDITIANIDNRIIGIAESIDEDSKEWLLDQEFKTIRECYKTCFNRFNSDIFNKLEFEGQNLRDWCVALFMSCNLRNKVVKFITDHSNVEGVRRRTTFRHPGDVISQFVDYTKNPIIIIEDDLKTGGVGIAKEYVRNVSDAYYYHGDKTTTHGILDMAMRLEDYEYEVLLTSELKAKYPVKKAVKATQSPTVQVYEMDDSCNVITSDVERDVLKNDSIHYVTMFRDFIEKSPRNEVQLKYAHRVIAWIMKKKDIKTVYIVRRKELRYVESNKNAICILDVKMDKQELTDAFSWSSYVLKSELDQRYYNKYNDAWCNSVIQEHFGFESAYVFDSSCIKELKCIYPEMNDIEAEYRDIVSDTVQKAESDTKNELLFALVNEYSQSDAVRKLIKLLEK